MADNKGVLVVGDIIEGKLAAITAEMLGAGKRLAEKLGEPLSAALLGSGIKALANEAIAFGAEKVFVVDDPNLKDYQSDAYVTAAESVIKQANPRIVILGQTSVGRDLAPRLAFRLNTAISMDCVELDVDANKQLVQTKPVYGGNARAIFTTDALPQMATVRPKAMSPLPRDDSRKGEVVDVPSGIDPAKIRTKFVKKIKEEVAGVKLEDAPAVVAGGRGIGGPEGFKQLEELARLLKGAVGATRPAVDNNWVPATIQVGLTGKIVAPELYIAVALSGSSQHMAGCSGSKTIVAINKDPESNIFREARFGIVGDWKQALPAFTAKVKELLKE
ncbi:MAG: electron transfer flavoprotein subunit alpha/FixB family protein [Dehalococcoidia bacterium]|nr:electron transfer flavoprotein subunit alpha/FixB family protein [Dehalococcoidia bacterium]